MKDMIPTLIFLVAAIAIYVLNNPKVNFSKDKEEGIHFHRGSWEEALQLAKAEQKIIFLDIYASWCSPCKKLKKYTFSDEKVGAYFNSNFINVTLDGEQGDGAALARNYELRGYPTLFFINAEGEVITQKMGYLSAKELIIWSKSISK